MTLITCVNKIVEIENNNNNTYKLITNIKKTDINIVILCIKFMQLEKDIVITNAYNIFGERLYDNYGVYILEDKYNLEMEFLKNMQKIRGILNENK